MLQLAARSRFTWALALLVTAAGPSPGWSATFQVTKSADTADGTCDADCSLREAIHAANGNANPGASDFVLVPAGTYTLAISGAGEDGNLTGDLDIVESIQIVGSSVAPTIIDGAGLDRVFDLFSPQAHFQDLTIRGGSTTGSGGGIRTQLSQPSGATQVSLDRCLLTANSAGAEGGAVAAAGAFVNSTFSGNSTAGGGALYAATYPVTLTNVTVAANNGAGLSGGGFMTSKNTLISGSCAFWGWTNSLGGNIESPGNTCGFSSGPGDLNSVAPATLALGALAENGGPSRTHALGTASVALAAGVSVNCPLVDQRGSSRDQPCTSGAREGNTASIFSADLEMGWFIGWSGWWSGI